MFFGIVFELYLLMWKYMGEGISMMWDGGFKFVW